MNDCDCGHGMDCHAAAGCRDCDCPRVPGRLDMLHAMLEEAITRLEGVQHELSKMKGGS